MLNIKQRQALSLACDCVSNVKQAAKSENSFEERLSLLGSTEVRKHVTYEMNKPCITHIHSVRVSMLVCEEVKIYHCLDFDS